MLAVVPIGPVVKVVAAVPITRRTFNAIAGAYTETAVSTAFSEPIAPQSTLELTFGIDRTQMTGATNALYSSLLRLTGRGQAVDALREGTVEELVQRMLARWSGADIAAAQRVLSSLAAELERSNGG